MTHIPVAGVPPHALDASFSEVLARVIELAGILAVDFRLVVLGGVGGHIGHSVGRAPKGIKLLPAMRC